MLMHAVFDATYINKKNNIESSSRLRMKTFWINMSNFLSVVVLQGLRFSFSCALPGEQLF